MAIVYAEEFGMSVIPLWPEKKNPLQKEWRAAQETRATVAEIGAWGKCNVGLVTGLISGVVVVDCESREDAKWFWKNRGETPVVVTTPRGVHLYFRHPGDGYHGNRAKVKDETGRVRFDVRGDGGYVVAPPSEVTADEKDVKVSGVYRFARGKELIHPSVLPVYEPAWAPAPVTNPAGERKTITDGRAYIAKIHATEGEGGDKATFTAACKLCEAGLSEGEALLALQEWNRTNAHPPWTDGELLHKVRCAFSTVRSV